MIKKRSVEKEVQIVGWVTEGEDEDDFEGVSIETDKEDYEVILDKVGKKLTRLIDEEVEVTGIVTVDEDGTHKIKVLNFEVLDFDEDEKDYEDDERFLDDY